MSMTIVGTIICDRCYCEEEFALPCFGNSISELRTAADRKGWKSDAEDLCPECVAEDGEEKA